MHESPWANVPLDCYAVLEAAGVLGTRVPFRPPLPPPQRLRKEFISLGPDRTTAKYTLMERYRRGWKAIRRHLTKH